MIAICQFDCFAGGAKDSSEIGKPIENPFDSTFVVWALSMKSRIRQHLIGPDVMGSRNGSRQPATGSSHQPTQLEDALKLIQKLERSICLNIAYLLDSFWTHP